MLIRRRGARKLRRVLRAGASGPFAPWGQRAPQCCRLLLAALGLLAASWLSSASPPLAALIPDASWPPLAAAVTSQISTASRSR